MASRLPRIPLVKGILKGLGKLAVGDLCIDAAKAMTQKCMWICSLFRIPPKFHVTLFQSLCYLSTMQHDLFLIFT